MLDCECQTWARTDELNGLTEHHPHCEKYQPPTTWPYQVADADGCAYDWCIAESEDQAISLASEGGCLMEEESVLTARKMTLDEASKTKLVGCDGETLLQEFYFSQKARVVASSEY